MKTAELTGAQLDYWTAHADGISAENLEIRPIPRSGNCHCVRIVRMQMLGPDQSEARNVAAEALNYSHDWHRGGPLVDKFRPHNMPSLNGGWWAAAGRSRFVHGSTPLEAICRAIVCSKFGEEVDEIAVEPMS